MRRPLTFAVVSLGAFFTQVVPAAACPQHAAEAHGLLGTLVEELVALVV